MVQGHSDTIIVNEYRMGKWKREKGGVVRGLGRVAGLKRSGWQGTD